MKDAICFIDWKSFGVETPPYDVIADAIIDAWKATGEKPTEERYGAEYLQFARDRNRDRKAAAERGETLPSPIC